MILTGSAIKEQRAAGRITIAPFSEANLEPNSYCFHLGDTMLCHVDEVLDVRRSPTVAELSIPRAGLVLEPGRLYLGSTAEELGSPYYASTLYARRSTSTFGMWLHFSAPLGHTGNAINWTLEIRVAHTVKVYPGMPIGKIAFWVTAGDTTPYRGKYARASAAMPSRLADESPCLDGAW